MLAGYPPFYDENPFGIYQKILAGKLEFPRHFETHARDLIRKLLTADRTKRIGNLKNGAEDIKKHKWYRGLNWAALYNKQMQAFIVPDVVSNDDTSQYDKYADSVEESGPLLNAQKDLEVPRSRRDRSAPRCARGCLPPVPDRARAARSSSATSSSRQPDDGWGVQWGASCGHRSRRNAALRPRTRNPQGQASRACGAQSGLEAGACTQNSLGDRGTG